MIIEPSTDYIVQRSRFRVFFLHRTRFEAIRNFMLVNRLGLILIYCRNCHITNFIKFNIPTHAMERRNWDRITLV